jgi:UDP-N-acetylmuramoyl-L-alanyl-D-glutamate--2,6-diaminopimelate ligase
VESGPERIRLELAWFGTRLDLESPLVGRHNVFNLMAAATAAHGLGLAPEAIQAGLARLRVVPGRFERVDLRLPFSVFIDYAHTPDALENVLKLAREVTAARLICLFGCGGDRDRAKRPKMGEIAARLADLVIVTSDNPRTEDPEAIIADIAEGLPADRSRIVTLPDRRAAIRRSLEMARPGDLILLAGKGHETYQVLGRDKVPFDERVIVKEAACSL